MEVPRAIAAIAPDGRLTPAQKRRFLIDLCLRRIQPGTGSAPEFLQRRTAMDPWPDLRPILQGIPWVIVGGVATRTYMPERATKDLDILVRQQDCDKVWERLEEAGYRYVSRLGVPGFLARSPEGVDLDVICGDYLVLMKMGAVRVQDMADVSRMLGLASEEELTRVRAIVTRYAPDETDDLESLIYLGQVEMGKVSPDESLFSRPR
jgi:hypothetical protein